MYYFSLKWCKQLLNNVTYLSNGMLKCLQKISFKTHLIKLVKVSFPKKENFPDDDVSQSERPKEKGMKGHRGLEGALMSPCATASGHENVLNDCWPDPRLDALLST